MKGESLKIIHPLHCDLVNMEINSQGCLTQEDSNKLKLGQKGKCVNHSCDYNYLIK